jgi:hypothetical protein
MSEHAVSTASPPGSHAATPGSSEQIGHGHRSWTIPTIVAVVMVLLALVGVALTTSDRAFASTFWVCLVPVYGLLCVGTAWVRSGPGKPFDRKAVIHQVLHWLGIGVALWLDFLVRRSGEETGVAAGLNALLVLALGCYLAGVHLEWMFAVVGALLTLTLIIVTKADQYLWLIFIVGGITLAGMLGVRWMLHKHASRKGAASLQPVSAKA